MEDHSISIVFVSEYKHFISSFQRKSKDDYVLNVNKIIKDKFKTKFIVPNRVQSFLLNYEIKKLLDKAINIKNKKYRRVIYLNSNISTPIILNTMTFIGEEYDKLTFTYHLIESRSLEEEISLIENLNRIKI
jgi:hypothetical protein